MTTVMDTLVQTPISTLLGAVTSLLKEKLDLIFNAKDNLEVLQQKLGCFQEALKVTDRKPFFSHERNRDLEGELKDVLYDAQDIIERYQTTIALCKRDKHFITSWNKVSKPWTTLCSCFKEHVSASYKLANDIKNINQKLDKIEKNKITADVLGMTRRNIGSEGPVSGKHDNPRETTHHMGVQPPTGREDDKKEIVKRLLSNDSTEGSKTQKGGVSIISIVGKGGIGKTTLAKMVFKETEEHFGKRRWWVCVSEMPNRKDLMRQILREVCKGSRENPDDSLSELCTQLRNELSKEKFLLVLDDVWELNWWEEEVGGTLMAGAMGSKILITSRKKDVSEGMGAYYMHPLPELSFHQSWELFIKGALGEGQAERDLEIHNVRDVGESIVKKCGGLPLVIKTVGSMMRTKKMSREDWKFVEDSEIWKWKTPATSSSSTEIGGDILPGLMLSYDDLPYYLKSCFVYCCIYPKDYEIERERLIMQWVTHRLIGEKEHIDVEATTESMDVEATANQYIEDLIRRCLIEEIDLKKVKLHDILHDLALYIGRREYSHTSATKHTRHLSLLGVHDAKAHNHNALKTTNKVRTLLVDSNSCLQVYIEHLTNFKWLRVLSLRGYRMDELPNSIQCLALLKYLDLRSSYVRRLPSSIGILCNLQTLDLSDSRIEELPKEMDELSNLRHLGLERTRHLNFIAEGLGKLTNLRTLRRFLVCDDKADRKGCNIWELKDLNKLKGELSIEGLGRSRKAIDHVGNAQLLKDKHGIISLEFDFGTKEGAFEQSSTSEQSGVLEALEPPLALEALEIRHYKGQMPAWHLKTEYTMLWTLELVRCPMWEKLISITSLKGLKVINCPALCEIASMPALESLEAKDCGSLQQLIHDMPVLKSLKVDGCKRLKTLPNMLALESLEVRDCDSLEQLPHEMPALKLLKVYISNSMKALVNMPALESLEVKDCGSLEQLADVPTLKSLDVEGCNMLKTVTNMPALKRLRLSRLNTLKRLPSRLPSLEELRVLELPNWEGWPAGGSGETTSTSIPSLREAYFYNCPKMQMEGLIDELAGLQSLSVLKCKGARLEWKLLEQLPNLIRLTLDGTALESTLPTPLPSEESAFLPSLKTLELRDNTNVDELKWGRVPEWVWELSQLQELNLHSFSEDISLGGHWQCLPKLRYLRLFRFPNLKSLVDVTTHQNENDSVATTCPLDANEQIASLSKLEKLEIWFCPALDLQQELRHHLGERLHIRN